MSSGFERALHVIAYHYVRDLPRSRFPRLNAMPADDFRQQVQTLQLEFEMATLESALAFVRGRYLPARDLCLLTFDDGVRDHWDSVCPYLVERNIQGVFFLITSCLDGRVAAVHKTHFLMAELGFERYRSRVMERLSSLSYQVPDIDRDKPRATYRWDNDDVGRFKYLLNFVLPESVRNRVLDDVFAESFGSEAAFAEELYLSWSEARRMQQSGMLIGGHTHKHAVLSTLSSSQQRADIGTSTVMLRRRLNHQSLWPFSYPYGKLDAFDHYTVNLLRELSYDCAFTTVPGSNRSRSDRFGLRRIDPKDAPASAAHRFAAVGLSQAGRVL